VNFLEDVFAEVDVGFIVETGMAAVDEPTVPPKKNENKYYKIVLKIGCLPEQVESLSESKSSNEMARPGSEANNRGKCASLGADCLAKAKLSGSRI
jgi:hypothetical protein